MFGLKTKRNTQRIFLDYASTTPLDPEILDEMMPYLKDNFFNSSSLYSEGVKIKKVIDEMRVLVARCLLVKKDEIYFTGSGTESNNIALLGAFEYAKNIGIKNPHFVTSSIEHPAILEVVKEIERRGGEVTYLPVSEDGIISEKDLENSLKKETIAVSIIYANNEIGVVQPIRSFSRIIKNFKEKNKIKTLYFHVDASQAPNYLDCHPNTLGVDMMTLDGHKIYGPKGIGCLYKNSSVKISPIMFGGGQESGLRSGTLNIPAIVGFAKALEKTSRMREKESKRLSMLQKYFINGVRSLIKDVVINGSENFRLPNNINICIPGIDAEFEVIKLDAKGVACAYTTSCKTSDDDSKSYVVEALKNGKCASSSLRFTLGRFTTKKEITGTLSIIKELYYNRK